MIKTYLCFISGLLKKFREQLNQNPWNFETTERTFKNSKWICKHFLFFTPTLYFPIFISQNKIKIQLRLFQLVFQALFLFNLKLPYRNSAREITILTSESCGSFFLICFRYENKFFPEIWLMKMSSLYPWNYLRFNENSHSFGKFSFVSLDFRWSFVYRFHGHNDLLFCGLVGIIQNKVFHLLASQGALAMISRLPKLYLVKSSLVCFSLSSQI